MYQLSNINPLTSVHCIPNIFTPMLCQQLFKCRVSLMHKFFEGFQFGVSGLVK